MAAVNFADHLWDLFNVVVKRSADVRVYSTEIASFFQKRALIEKEYAQKLLKLVKSTNMSDIGTASNLWNDIKTETEHLTQWHDDFADRLVNEVSQGILTFLADSRRQRRALVDDGNRIIKELEVSEDKREKAKVSYERARKKQDEVQEEYEKATFSSQPPNVVQKIGKKVQAATKLSARADSAYKAAVQGLVESQTKMYDTEMPKVLKEFQTMEEMRLKTVMTSLQRFNTLQEGLVAQVTERCTKIKQSLGNVSVDKDIVSFVEMNMTRKKKPEKAEYEPYDNKAKVCRAGADLSDRPNIVDLDQPAPKQVNQGKAPLPNPRASLPNPIPAQNARGPAPGFRPMSMAPGMIMNQRPSQSQLAGAHSNGVSTNFRASIAQAPQPQAVHRSSVHTPAKPQVRALFDYNGETGAELSFKKGDIITVTEKDDSGWWQGELNGVVGAFPSSGWVEELPAAYSSYSSSGHAVPVPSAGPSHAASAILSPRYNPPVKRCRALYDFAAENAEEVTMSAGDTMTIDCPESAGWYTGTNETTGAVGRYPVSYVELI